MSKRASHTHLSRGPSRRALLSALGIGALGLAGCQVRPLYGDQDLALGGRSATASALASISIDPPTDRTTQLVRNELFFGIDSGSAPAIYRLALRANTRLVTLGVSGTGAAFARAARVTATYQLYRLGETEVLLENTVFSTASYDSVGQRFSNQRASIDAETRAAKDVARVIETQLAVALASAG